MALLNIVLIMNAIPAQITVQLALNQIMQINAWLWIAQLGDIKELVEIHFPALMNVKLKENI